MDRGGAFGFTRREAIAAGAGFLTWAAARDAFAEDAPDVAKHLTEVAKQVRPMAQGCKEAQELIRPVLKAYAKAVESAGLDVRSKDPTTRGEGWARGSAWNDLLTLAHYHDVATRERYACYASTVAFEKIRTCFPVSLRWKFGKADGDQLSERIEQQHLGKDPARTIKIWYYNWRTVYSGVPGENAQKLADVMLEVDRANMDTGKREVSDRVVIKRFNKAFPRSHHYVVRGHDDEYKGEVRRSSWYIKGKLFTTCVELIERLAEGLDEDAVTKWHRTGPCPELAFFFDSMVPDES